LLSNVGAAPASLTVRISFLVTSPAREFVVATRKSPLAMAQTEMTVAAFEKALSGTRYHIEKMVTTGDRQREWS